MIDQDQVIILFLGLSYKTHFLLVMNLLKLIKDKGIKLIYTPNNSLKLKSKRWF